CGPDAENTATDLNTLALPHPRLARNSEAEPLYRRAIAIDEKVLGKDHPAVAIEYNNLALFLVQNQHKYDEAEPLYRRAIEILEKDVLGEDVATRYNTLMLQHVVTGYNNLTLLLQAQHKYD